MRFVTLVAIFALWTGNTLAQTFDLSQLVPAGEGTFSGRVIQGLVLLSVLSIAPGLLVTTTSFTRFVIAFSFLRSGLGLQSTPSNLIVISLSMFMTFFVMSPVFEKSWREGVQPLMENEIDQDEAFGKITDPLKEFMLRHIRDKDLALFDEFVRQSNTPNASAEPQSEPDANTPELKIVMPAFLVSEIRRGFEIGFLILLPFLIIDLVVSTVTMSMGMMMLPPTVVSLPFKILFFVLIDGWNIIVGELLNSML